MDGKTVINFINIQLEMSYMAVEIFGVVLANTRRLMLLFSKLIYQK
jgi:hypothetical protein